MRWVLQPYVDTNEAPHQAPEPGANCFAPTKCFTELSSHKSAHAAAVVSTDGGTIGTAYAPANDRTNRGADTATVAHSDPRAISCAHVAAVPLAYL